VTLHSTVALEPQKIFHLVTASERLNNFGEKFSPQRGGIAHTFSLLRNQRLPSIWQENFFYQQRIFLTARDCGQFILTKEEWKQKERKRRNSRLFYQTLNNAK